MVSCFQTKVYSYTSDQGEDWTNVKNLFKTNVCTTKLSTSHVQDIEVTVMNLSK